VIYSEAPVASVPTPSKPAETPSVYAPVYPSSGGAVVPVPTGGMVTSLIPSSAINGNATTTSQPLQVTANAGDMVGVNRMGATVVFGLAAIFVL
jgi:hypothetical protein